MIAYHGLPINPSTVAVEACFAGHAFVSFSDPGQIGVAQEVCQSFALDNGAFSAWRSGRPVLDWSSYYDWVAALMRHPGFDFAVVPDVVDGTEAENDALADAWPHPRWIGAPVWHMHESIERLCRLCLAWPRVCLGSSGDYATVGNAVWWHRMAQAMDAVCVDGLPIARLHGLRMLNPDVFRFLPLSSADSTNIGQNVGIDKKWQGTYLPPTKEARAAVLRRRIESVSGAQRWAGPPTDISHVGRQEELSL